ncbi:mechanosensitive ion channel family protein [Curvivirga sp.]|uniref:mechanosensitive ion channel family protein n=1 Tax=Curvivirga sp. TaxID=2856848 RepID=UPI003B5C0073
METTFGTELRNRLWELFYELPVFQEQVLFALREATTAGDMSWLFPTLALALLYFGIGLLGLRFVNNWARNQFAHFFKDEPKDVSEKLSFLWFRGFMQAIATGVAFVIATLLAYLTNDSGGAELTTQLAVISIGSSVVLVHYIFYNLSGLDVPEYRALPMNDEQARGFYRDFTFLISFGIATVQICFWLGDIGVHSQSYKLILLIGTTIIVVATSALVIYRSRKIRVFLRSLSKEDKPGPLLEVISRIWHLLVIFYVLAAWAKVSVSLLMGWPTGIALALSPFFWAYLSLAVYGLLLIVIERIFAKLEQQHEQVEDIAESVLQADRKSLKALCIKGARIIVSVVFLGIVLRAWGLDPLAEDGMVVEFFDILIVLFFAYMVYEAIKITIDNKIADELGDVTEPEPGDEGGGASAASRLATLLPMFRNALLFTVLVISGMIVLSEMGVDVAPLFAGAGVVGLAVGFGAQTLIRDIFSGAFFLIDDAFRKGEYIDLGTVKGTVERISIRSLQLRHHLGALHTIPFGEILHLTNYSRDWVMMKLTLRVTYDTDVEKVRKLIKKLGQQLLEHPEVGASFLQPLKSQGVYKMEDSAMILRVKFMTKPGEQFVARKLVYSQIRELFAKEGIKFAHREVTVRLAGDDGKNIDADNLSEEDKKAIAGAVLPPDENTPATSKT